VVQAFLRFLALNESLMQTFPNPDNNNEAWGSDIITNDYYIGSNVKTWATEFY